MILSIKGKIKKIIGMPFITTDQEIEITLEKVKVVSFDIFDTLVKRNVSRPEDIHYLVQTQFYKQTGISIDGYSQIRINAEKVAREKICSEEVSLEEIFDFIHNIPKEQKIILQNIEETMELENCCPNLKMQRVYEKAVKDNKHIIITSDMYLSENIIYQILYKCGYSKFEKLYLSSSYKLCKSTGSIFEKIKEDYADYGGLILHIGDNIKSDFFIPRMRGINALLINGQEKFLKYWKPTNKKIKDKFLYRSIVAFLNHHITPECDNAERIGYEVLGPILLGYCKWLHYMLNKNDISKIFFLSREGKILQSAYNILYPQSKIEQCYLYVSRQALTVPLIAEANNFDEIVDILKCNLHTPLLRTIGVLCGIDRICFKNKIKEIGLDENIKIHEIPQNKKEQIFSIIKELGNDHFIYQKKLVQSYLEEINFTGRVAIADIGWAGTMQIALQQYISNNTEIFGYYLGVRNAEKDSYYLGVCREGYLFSPGINQKFNLMARFTTEIMEMMFLNGDGSVQKYEMDEKEQKVLPVFNNAEYIGKENAMIDAIQNSGVKFLELIKKNVIINEIDVVPEDIVMSSYATYAVYPSLNTLKIFQDFQFLDGEVRKLFVSHNIFYYLVHPLKFKNDLNQGKIFFLKNVFKLRFPYFDFLRLMTKLGIESEYRKKYINKQ